jgi:hypothetical protein
MTIQYGACVLHAGDYTIRRMRIACWITKATETRAVQYLLLFHDGNGYGNAPQY